MTRKEKKRLIKETVAYILQYSDKELMDNITECELIWIPEIPKDIMTKCEMKKLIRKMRDSLFLISDRFTSRNIKNEELGYINNLLDDRVLEAILAPEGYNFRMRIFKVSQLSRMELLKALKFPEWSYRKFCEIGINPLEEKENRAFVRLPLHKILNIDHTLLSRFRSGLSFSQQINLMLYFIVRMEEEGLITGNMAHFIDSTEIAAKCCPYPLCTIEVDGQKVRIYNSLDVDCGARRNKRDKSLYVVGYRVHSLIALDPKHGRGFPLVTLVAPANHHDSNYIKVLLTIAQAMGSGVKLVVADSAYGEPQDLEEIRKDTGTVVIPMPDTKVKLPEYVDEFGAVYCNKFCENPMKYMGRTETGHDYQCDTNDCLFSCNCARHRELHLDAGYFSQIPHGVYEIYKCKNTRKNGERAFNLLKHIEGIEPLRVRSQRAAQSVVTFAMIIQLIRNFRRMRGETANKVSIKKLKLFEAA